MTNAFEIPKQSIFVKNRDRTFFKKMPKYHRNMSEISLPNSSKYPPLAFMKKPHEHK